MIIGVLRSKILLGILLILGLAINVEARDRVFPEKGIITFAGLDDTTSTPISNDGRAADLQNITLGLSGNIQKRFGYSKVVSLDILDREALNEPVTGLYELYKANGERFRLAVCGNKVFSWELNGSKTDITGSLTIAKKQDFLWSWVTALDNIIGTDEYSIPIKWNGAGNASTVSFTGLSSSITKAKCVAWWKNYLIFGNTTEGVTTYTTRVRWSNVGTIGTWTDADFVDVATQGGQQIEGFGQLYDNLFIFLTDSIYKVSLVGGDELIVITKVSDRIGAIAKNSIKSITISNQEGLVFLSKDGIINFLDGVNVVEISTLIHTTLDKLKSSRLPYAVSEVDNFNSHYYLSTTDGTDTLTTSTNNLLLDFYYKISEWFKHTQIDINSMCLANNGNGIPQIYFGNYDAFVYQLNDISYRNDISGLTGTLTNQLGRDIISTSTATGLTILYDTALTDYTKLLLHFEGINGTNTFIDEAGKAITVVGNSQISTSQYKIDSASGKFDGTGDYCSLIDSDGWNFGSGDFTIDFWVRFDSFPAVDTYAQIVLQYTNDSNYNSFSIGYLGERFNVDCNTSGVADVSFTKTITTSLSTWYHVAFVRNGNDWLIFLDGVQQGTTVSDSSALTDHTGSLYIGGKQGIIGVDFDGYIDELRISKGVARWTSNFTPSTTAYTNSDMSSRLDGATITITSGTGIGEEMVIASTTSTGIVVTSDTIATGLSTYSIGAIDSYYVTKWYDTGNAMLRKNFKELNIWAETQQSESIGVSYATDEDTSITSTSIDLSGGEEFGGTSISTGPTVTNASWVGVSTNFSMEPLNVSGRYIKLRFGDYDIDDTMNLWGYSILLEDLDFK